MGKTTSEKILARASGQESVSAGDIIWANVDRAMMDDILGPRVQIAEKIQALGGKVWDPEKVVIISDHYTPPASIQQAEIVKFTRDWARQYGVEQYFEFAGPCHQVMAETGNVRPGSVVLGTDSHTCMGGALGAFATGIGSTEMLGVLVTGQTWLKVPETIRVLWQGALPAGVMTKDISLKTIGMIGRAGATYKAVEYAGETIRALSMDERMAITNMAVEMGAKVGLMPVDETTKAYLAARGITNYPVDASDPDAVFCAEHRFDASALAPQVACPHGVDQVTEAKTVREPIHQAYLGSCTGGRLNDIRQAAQLLKGKKIAKGVRMLVSPASCAIWKQADEAGYLRTLADAGAVILAPTCGVDANEALKKATSSYGRFREAVSTIDPRKERTMALFQNYDQRIGAVEAFLNMYGNSSLDEAGKICTDAGIDVFSIVRGVQPICFDDACYAYLVGAAAALKSSAKTAGEIALILDEGLQSFCIPGSVSSERQIGLGHGKLASMILSENVKCFCFLAGHKSFAAAEGALGIARSANQARQTPIRVILNGMGKDAADSIARINGFTYVRTHFDFTENKLYIDDETPYSTDERADVRCYGAFEPREGIAIMTHEQVDVSISGNATHMIRFQHPVAGAYKKYCSDNGKRYFACASGGGIGRTLNPDDTSAGPSSYGQTDLMSRMYADATFAGSSSVPAHVEMMGFIGMGNNPMVGATVAMAVRLASLRKGK